MDHVSFKLPVDPEVCQHTVFTGKVISKAMIILTSASKDMYADKDHSDLMELYRALNLCAYDFNQNNKRFNSKQLNNILYMFCRDMLLGAKEPIDSYLN